MIRLLKNLLLLTCVLFCFDSYADLIIPDQSYHTHSYLQLPPSSLILTQQLLPMAAVMFIAGIGILWLLRKRRQKN